jgi:hypothetical protein
MTESPTQFDPDDDPRTRPVESAGQAEALGVIAEAQGRHEDADALAAVASDRPDERAESVDPR